MGNFNINQLATRFDKKLDPVLKKELQSLADALKNTPLDELDAKENELKINKKLQIIMEFEQLDGDNTSNPLDEAKTIISKHQHCAIMEHIADANCCTATLTPNAISELLEKSPKIKRLHFDRPVKAMLNDAIPSIRANLVHQSGFTGRSISIAIVDTGVLPHPDIADRIIGFKDFVNGRKVAYDDNGHGTHCAGDAAGDGKMSGGKYRGSAPGADIVGVKVLDRYGNGSLSAVMNGIQWCIDNRFNMNIRIINLSLGAEAVMSATEDPLVQLCEKAWRMGIVVVAAAGNEGPGLRTISSPGISPVIITVGAMNTKETVDRRDDTPANFSSRGPTIDGVIKPDLLVPGVGIVSLRSPNSDSDVTEPGNRVGPYYFAMSGTSMATPICAGICALIIQQNRYLRPDLVKTVLLRNAVDWGAPAYIQGKGYLDAGRLIATPAAKEDVKEDVKEA